MSDDAKIVERMEKMIMQVLAKNGILKGNKVYGTVVEQINRTTVSVILEGSDDRKPIHVKCSPYVEFNTGDYVLIEHINNNPHDRFIVAVVREGGFVGKDEEDTIDYSLLPYEPVEIFRNEQDRAYKFMYGYDKIETTWYQELFRNEKNQVVDVVHTYPDGVILIRTLYRNEKEQVYKYE